MNLIAMRVREIFKLTHYPNVADVVGAVGITPQVLMGRLTEKIATLMSFEHRGGPAKVSTAQSMRHGWATSAWRVKTRKCNCQQKWQPASVPRPQGSRNRSGDGRLTRRSGLAAYLATETRRSFPFRHPSVVSTGFLRCFLNPYLREFQNLFCG